MVAIQSSRSSATRNIRGDVFHDSRTSQRRYTRGRPPRTGGETGGERNRCNPRTGDCRRNKFLELADGVAVTFIPDNDREETGGSGEKG